MNPRVAEMTPDALIAEARARTGLTDLGDEAFLDALPAFLAGLREQDGQFSEFGGLVLHEELVGAVERRLRIHDYFRQHPEASAETIRRPIFITGLYRSGTSRLQELLCADPNLQYLTQWQTVSPTPTEDGRPGEDDPRIAKGQAGLDMLAALAPHAAVAHPLTARSPSEEFPLMTMSFRVLDAKQVRSGFSAWLAKQDNGPMYRDLRRALQVLQHQFKQPDASEPRYCLKAPLHLGHLDLLFREFSDARVLITHRDPFPAIHSFAMVRESLRGMYSDVVDPVAIGEEVLEQSSRALARSVEVRPSLPADGIFDLSFDDIVGRMPERLEEIYTFIESPMNDLVRAALDVEERRRDQHRSRAATTDPAVFGLTRELVNDATAGYRAFAHSRGLSLTSASDE